MIAKILSYGILGIDAYPIEVEVDVSSGGLPVVNLVGSADTAIKESKVRVKTAIKNSGFEWPGTRITISLAPSHIKKEGPGYDLAIALGVLAASGQCSAERLRDHYFLGELSLDGGLRPTRGVLPVSMAIARAGGVNIVLPCHNAKEAALVSEIKAWPVETLRQAVDFLNGQGERAPFAIDRSHLFAEHAKYPVDFSDVTGQCAAKRSLEVAVAGGHNILSMGTQYGRRTGKRAD